jgi:hypothetical protein
MYTVMVSILNVPPKIMAGSPTDSALGRWGKLWEVIGRDQLTGSMALPLQLSLSLSAYLGVSSFALHVLPTVMLGLIIGPK